MVERHGITAEACFSFGVWLEGLAVLDTLLDPFLARGRTTTSTIPSTPLAPT